MDKLVPVMACVALPTGSINVHTPVFNEPELKLSETIVEGLFLNFAWIV